jgi:hypothetical protein
MKECKKFEREDWGSQASTYMPLSQAVHLGSYWSYLVKVQLPPCIVPGDWNSVLLSESQPQILDAIPHRCGTVEECAQGNYSVKEEPEQTCT